MTLRTYNPSVRIGNWNEDVCLEEDMLKDFLDKRERGDLLIQRAHKLLETILKKTELSVSRDGFVHFGDMVMLINPGQENEAQALQQIDPLRKPLALAINMNEYSLFMEDAIDKPCNVSATPLLKPHVRNSFIITSVDGSENGAVLRYGQPFAIATLPGFAENLKLFSDHRRFNLNAKKSRQQIVQLVEEVNYLTTWQVVPFHPQHRLELEGLPVPGNAKVVLKHNKTGNHLNLVSEYKIRTIFGREFEVNAHTRLDSHKAEMDNNHWVIVSGNPSDEEHTHFDRPNPEPNCAPKAEDIERLEKARAEIKAKTAESKEKPEENDKPATS